MNKILNIMLIFFVITNYLCAQSVLQNQKISNSDMILHFKNDNKFKVDKLGSRNVIVFQSYSDESSPGDVQIPSYDIFISLPILENPEVQFRVLSQKEFSASPQFNNKVELNYKKEFVYSEPTVFKNTKINHFKVKGYLWIEDSYCLHVEIVPAIFNSSKNTTTVLEKFEIKLSFNKEISSVKTSQQVNKIISNNVYKLQNSLEKFSSASNDAWIDYSKQYVKIGTAQDGVYRINKSDLENLGIITTSINPKTFKIFCKGEEIPIFVDGQSDLSFDHEDYIEFVGIRNMGGKHREVSDYGEPYNEYLGRYTDTTVYWLTWEGLNGKRVNVVSNTVEHNDTLNFYSHIDHYETNIWFDYSVDSQIRREMPHWIENKTWGHNWVGVGTQNRSFSVNEVYPDYEAKLIIKLQDYASNVSLNAHHLALSLNSEPERYDSTYINKAEHAVLEAIVPSSQLKNGDNQLKIHSYKTDASLNSCFFDWYEIEYPRYLVPIDSQLNFQFLYLENNSEKNIHIMDILSNDFVIWKYGGSYKKYDVSRENNHIIFSDSVTKKDKFIYVDVLKISSPKLYYSKKFKNLKSNQNNADYIAITHKKFIDNVAQYTDFISFEYNLETIVVDIDDIYDEYSFGFFNPEAIKEFLISTHNYWNDAKPKFVSLIGNATYDYYGNRYNASDAIDEKAINYVPSYGAPVSDNWFVTWDTTGAYLPQMNIGRIPIKTNSEFEWYFEKHQNFLAQGYDEWNKKYLFFTGGNPENESEINSLKQSNQFVIDKYVEPSPIGGISNHFYKTINPTTNFGPYTSEYVEETIQQGAMFISYLGHSGTQTWDNTIISPEQLMNVKNRYPIVSDFGCSTSKFAEPDVTSFSELFTLSNIGQALGYFGNSSLGFLSTSTIFPKLFYKNILVNNITRVSEAHKLSKIEMLQSYGSSGVYKLFSLTNCFIGDPVLKLQIPEKTNLVIEQTGFNILESQITDLDDSISVEIIYKNLGKVSDRDLEILVYHEYENSTDSLNFKMSIPKFLDTLYFPLITKNKVGNHVVKVEIDPHNKIEEIDEDDNLLQFDFNVASSAIRTFFQSKNINSVQEKIMFLNPTLEMAGTEIIMELASDSDFMKSNTFQLDMDTIITDLILSDLNEERHWLRAKTNYTEYSPSISFIKGNEKSLFSDSLSFSLLKTNDIFYKNNSLNIDTTKVKFELISAGFSDGKTALIMKSGQNMIGENTIRGHHVCLFDESNLELIDWKVFNLLSGGSAESELYLNYLDTISTKLLAMFVINDEGSINLTSDLREKIKEFGSTLIDSVGFRSSWAFIGKKGITPGIMPESFSNEGDGLVRIDTTISFLSSRGSFVTPEIGKAGKWENFSVNQHIPSDSFIKYIPIGIRVDGDEDTLTALNLVDSVVSLDHISSVIYPKVKILAEFEAGNNNISPELYSLGVDYVGVPELAINYQVVSIEQDTLQQGEDVNLNFYVYNVGESTADSFIVSVDMVKPDNSKERIYSTLVDSLGSEQRKKFEVSYNTTSFNGERSLEISIDGDNNVTELFEDNNFYNIPFYVKGDTTKPSMQLTIDGNDIFEGEYISSNPNIKIELSDPSLIPITDTSSISVFLNNRYINYLGNEENIKINFSEMNPKVTVNFTPELEDGEYTLRVFGKDASENIGDSAGITKYFNVSNDPKLLQVYNYPNPFSSDTYFTFKLTQIPDDIKIKIFTVAGRLIREISRNSSQLKYDLNKIYWNGRDNDGDLIGNGVYLYKVIMNVNGKKTDITQKLAVVR